MNKIIQTKVDKKAVGEVNEEITRLEEIIVDTNKSIDHFMRKKKDLLTTYFCGKKIAFEQEGDYANGRLYYDLYIYVSNTYRVKARAYTNAHDMTTFVANIEGQAEDTNIQFNIKTFDEAKQICRQWLADLIYSNYQEDD